MPKKPQPKQESKLKPQPKPLPQTPPQPLPQPKPKSRRKLNWAVVAAAVSAGTSLVAIFYSCSANINSQTSNSIAQSANSIAQTASAKIDKSNSIAQTANAKIDISNSIAQTQVAQAQEANFPDLQEPESNCLQSVVSVAACKNTQTAFYTLLNLHDQFIFTNNGGASVFLTRVRLTDEYKRQYVVELYRSSTNTVCPEPLDTNALALPLDVLPHNEITWYMKGTYRDFGLNSLYGSILNLTSEYINLSFSDGNIQLNVPTQNSNMNDVMTEYASLNGLKLHLTWTFDFSYGDPETKTTVTNQIVTSPINFSQPNSACQLDSNNP